MKDAVRGHISDSFFEVDSAERMPQLYFARGSTFAQHDTVHVPLAGQVKAEILTDVELSMGLESFPKDVPVIISAVYKRDETTKDKEIITYQYIGDSDH